MRGTDLLSWPHLNVPKGRWHNMYFGLQIPEYFDSCIDVFQIWSSSVSSRPGSGALTASSPSQRLCSANHQMDISSLELKINVLFSSSRQAWERFCQLCSSYRCLPLIWKYPHINHPVSGKSNARLYFLENAQASSFSSAMVVCLYPHKLISLIM